MAENTKPPVKKRGSHVVAAFVAVIAISFAILTVFSIVLVQSVERGNENATLIKQNADITKQNRTLIRQTHQLAAQAKALAVQGQEAHDTLCFYRANLVSRIKEGEQFFKDHPFDFPKSVVDATRLSLKNQKRAIEGLRISCLSDKDRG